jgi:hypothetical protein
VFFGERETVMIALAIVFKQRANDDITRFPVVFAQIPKAEPSYTVLLILESRRYPGGSEEEKGLRGEGVYIHFPPPSPSSMSTSQILLSLHPDSLLLMKPPPLRFGPSTLHILR